jgi:iron(III) transport system ATP-binding protein
MLSVRSLTTLHEHDGAPPVLAVDDVSFEIPEGRFFTLLGPSGCGKTTTLRSIAGLAPPAAGEVMLDGAALHSSSRGVSVPPDRRRIGMVFQSYAIWPHMTVFENVAFPLRAGRERVTSAEIGRRVGDALQMVQLGELRDRAATRLSGGQQQRLAIARAVVMRPRLLLMDEPLASLDARLREAMRFELKRLQRELRITTLYVTHDQSEALALSHGIGVMERGRLQQVGTPRDVYGRPANRFVAEFLGAANFVPARVGKATGAPGAWSMETPFGALEVTAGARSLSRGETVLVFVRPEDVHLSTARPASANAFEARVVQKVFLGDASDFRVRIGDFVLQSRTHPELRTRKGESLWVRIEPDRCVVVE